MSKLGRTVLFILLTLLFLQILIGFPISIEQGIEPAELATAQEFKDGIEGTQEQQMGKIHLVESRDGARDWELFAEQAVGSEGQGSWQLSEVKVQFYSQGRLEFVVTGKSGIIDTKTKDMKIMGSVVTRASNGYLFQTEQIDYEAGLRILRSPVAVRMIGPKDSREGSIRITGGSLEAKIDEGYAVIKPKVVAERSFSHNRSFVIHAGASRLSRVDSSLEFFDQVSIEVDTMKIAGPQARFAYKPGSDLLQSVIFKGGVKVSDVDKFATSDQVQFDPEQNQFVLTGRPRVVQNQDEIVGERIIFLDGGKRVKVDKIRARVEEAP